MVAATVNQTLGLNALDINVQICFSPKMEADTPDALAWLAAAVAGVDVAAGLPPVVVAVAGWTRDGHSLAQWPFRPQFLQVSPASG